MLGCPTGFEFQLQPELAYSDVGVGETTFATQRCGGDLSVWSRTGHLGTAPSCMTTLRIVEKEGASVRFDAKFRDMNVPSERRERDRGVGVWPAPPPWPLT